MKVIDTWNSVIIVVGSQCVGKTTLLEAPLPEGIRIKVELAAGEIGNAGEMIEDALASGRHVIIEMVFSVDPKALVQRMVSRATSKNGAVVHRISDMAKDFVGVPVVMRELVNQFADRVEFITVDNSGSLQETIFHIAPNSSHLVKNVVIAQKDYLRSIGRTRAE